jgi:peptide/nickel transport system permease protein
MLIALVNGAVIAEVVFGWPGVGLLILQAIQQGDLPLIQAAIFVTASVIVILTLLVDLAYLRINPRVRLQ